MIWILVWFLAAAVIAPVLGMFLDRAGKIAEGMELVGEVERYLAHNVTEVIEGN